MAVQSLYRRYRPRRFSEVKGQDHVVTALRNAVINSREGQGYLFSGPRGTGKTTSARILAKVLNCTDPQDGEPCCACESCLAVESGTSYDVHELDAASNNGVEAMRDLIEKASLGTPGRHKVYILDEVHMLSKGAEAALLKTLEEPPPHVVFVLATTDPQKVSATIRSRVQHLEFHLLAMSELDRHVRWVAADAGLEISDAALQQVLEQGGGSARDTLSALELVAASGGDVGESFSYDEFIEAFINDDPGQALSALAHAVQQGRDARTLAQELVRHLRDGFLSLMAPELVQLPEQRAAVVSDQAVRMGAAAIVRAMEKLGEMLVEMRHAPDPRLLLDVALVQLTRSAGAGGADLTALMARIEKLERQVAQGVAAAPASSAAAAAVARPPAIDPRTGRAALGGRAGRDATQPVARPVDPHAAATTPTSSSSASVSSTSPTGAEADTSPLERVAAASPVGTAEAPTAPTSVPNPTGAASVGAAAAMVSTRWQSDILPTLKPMARALFSAGRFLGERSGSLAFGFPNEPHRSRCEQHRADVEAAIAAAIGSRFDVVLVVDAGSDDQLAAVIALSSSRPQSSPTARPGPAQADEDIDLDDLIDAPPDSVQTPLDQLEQAFPGSKLIDDGN